MSKDNYNDQYSGYSGFDDNYNEQNNYYQNNDYSMQMDQNGMNSDMGYSSDSWNGYNQQGYNMNNQNGYMDYEYNYYDDNEAYMYNDQYSIDYSNSSSNYANYDYGYNQANNDISIYDISSKINANVDQEIMYDNFENKYGNANYDQSYSFDNKTVPMDMYNYQDGSNNMNNTNYGGIDTNSSNYQRRGAYDNKLMPTEDIMFDDIYVVRNQLFEEEEKLFSFNDIISLAICISFAIIMAFLIIRYVAQVTEVKGSSMKYNLLNGEILVLDKLSYELGEPERFDIVVFPVNDGKGKNGISYYIKRIIGLPKEKVYIDVETSSVFINGENINYKEIYGFENFSPDLSVQVNDITLGEDEYYCMGDNRNNSQDSRFTSVGPIKRDNFVGKAIFKVSPITSFGLIDSKYNNDIRNGKRERPANYDKQNGQS